MYGLLTKYEVKMAGNFMAVTGYPSGQDGAIMPAREYPPCPARKISAKASFID